MYIIRRILNNDCYEAYKVRGLLMIIGFILVFSCKVNAANVESKPMYRMYNTNSGEHFYTSDRYEKGNLINSGWTYEGVGWMAPSSSNVPVYRLYNPNAGDHHYTIDASEKNSLVSMGWSDEGIGWYSDENNTVPILRQYNRNNIAGAHNYTVNVEEKDYLVNIGWNDEGIGWYGTDTGDNAQVSSRSEAELRSIASQYGNIGIWGYADYDGNGSGEAFAVIGDTDAYHDNDVRIKRVIFINEKGSIGNVITDIDGFAYYDDEISRPNHVRFCEGKGFFWTNYGAYGSGFQTMLLSVRNDYPYELNISRNIQGFFQDEIGLYTEKNDYSKGYHDYLKQELVYNSNTQQFTKGGTRGSVF